MRADRELQAGSHASASADVSAPGSLRDIARHMVVPQGFTLSIAGTIATLVGRRHDTAPLTVWLFIVGAGVGYVLVSLVSGSHRGAASPGSLSIEGVRVLNLVPVVVVPLATWTADLIPYTPAAFACGGFVAVAAYFVGLWGFLRGLSTAGRPVLRRQSRASSTLRTEPNPVR